MIGSRDWEDREMVHNMLLLYSGGRGTVLVHGACPTGADLIADEIARGWPWMIERHPANWSAPCRGDCSPHHRRPNRRQVGSTYCPAAGAYRNQDMIDLGATVVLAFQRNGSRGTQDCIDRARAAGLRVIVKESS